MSYFEHLAILICIYSIVSISLNIIVGFTGLLNLGHAAFFGIGAYASALLTMGTSVVHTKWILVFILCFTAAIILKYLGETYLPKIWRKQKAIEKKIAYCTIASILSLLISIVFVFLLTKIVMFLLTSVSAFYYPETATANIIKLPFYLALIIASLSASFGGFFISIPCLRLRGDYLAIATLGFSEIIRAIAKNWTELTRGPLGLPGIPKAELFGITFNSSTKFLILCLIFAALTYFIVHRLMYSPFGRVLRAIREDEVAAQSCGKNLTKYKLLAVVIGSAFAGIAGSLYAHYITFIDPTMLNFMEIVLMLCMVVLGGMGSLPGSIIGTMVIVLLPEPLRFIGIPSSAAGALRQMMYAIIIILLMIYRPNGLLGEKRYKTKIGTVKEKG